MSVRHVISVSTTISTGCEFCTEFIDSRFFPDGVNHYLQAHGCTLLHIGGHTEHDQDGKPWHGTIVVLGSDVVPQKRTPVGTVIVPPKAPG